MQLWVNLPRADKRAEPRYQDITGDKLTLFRNDRRQRARAAHRG